MSKYSGKCDFYDHIELYGVEDILNGTIFIDNKKIEITDEKECIPYYNHILSSYASGRTDKHCAVLDKYSWLRRERERYGPLLCHSSYKRLLNETLEKNGLDLIYSKEETQPDFFSKIDKFKYLFKIKTISYKHNIEVIICKNQDCKYFILIGNLYKKNKYLLCEINKEELDNLEDKNISIKDIFVNKDEVYFTKYDIDSDSLKIRKYKGKNISEKYFKYLT